MSEINGVSRSHGAGPMDPTSLDGDMLLAYCASQLNDLNADIKARMVTQHQLRDTKGLLNDVRALIQPKKDGGTFSEAEKKEILEKYARAIQGTPVGPLRDRMFAAFQEFRSTACYNDAKAPEETDIDGYLAKGGAVADSRVAQTEGTFNNNLDQAEIEKQVSLLGAIAEDAGKNVELDMITLNQLVAQRQMAVQLTSQLMSKVNQGAEACVNNIK
jgi:hypothetical protein